MKKNVSILVVFVLCLLAAEAQSLIPQPQEMVIKKGKRIKMRKLLAETDARMNLPDEGYVIETKGSKVYLRAKTARGIVWGKATIEQLTDEDGTMPQVYIKDYPLFPLRGFMHDTGRNFRSVEQIKEEIELFSFYKLNLFHWHLTDNPAWRIECKTYPQLNDARYQRKGRDEGCFYSYREIREVIAYARERGVTVLPEIDMPGHSEYFKNTFGFGMATPQGMQVLDSCLMEFFREIPAEDCPYLHIGSDEVHIDHPREFIAHYEKLVRGHGRTPVVWDPGLPAAATTVCQIWNEKIGIGIAEKGFSKPYIDSYMGYLNYYNPILLTSRLFIHKPCNVEHADGKALGGILCLWNDVRVADKEKLFPHNGMPNCLLPFAERFWRGGESFTTGQNRLLPAPESEAAQKLYEMERRMVVHRDRFLKKWNMRWVANAAQPWQISLPVEHGADTAGMQWVKVWGGVIDLPEVCRQYGVTQTEQMDAWAKTKLYAERDTVIAAWVGFDSPMRSNRKSDGIGEQGLWESRGRLFVGESEIFPSVAWIEPGKYRYHYNTWNRDEAEQPYTDEQLFWMRPAAKIPLKKGWNMITLYCPKVFDGSVWHCAFIPLTVDKEGKVSEAQGIRFE